MTSPVSPLSPRQALFDSSDLPRLLPVCDHYAGVEDRMRKSLLLQAEMGPVFDVTLDNEDGAPVGGEIDQAYLIAAMLAGADNRHDRVGVRLLPVSHPNFADVAGIVLRSARAPAYLMLPKAESAADIDTAASVVAEAGGGDIPLHALVETHGGLREVFALAAHPRVESLSFGLMDFVSAHRGAIPITAMTADGQFKHPLVVRAKLEIAAACHAHGKTPSHCVVTEFKHRHALEDAAEKACNLLGYTRMWSIHPSQIRPIVEAFAPRAAEVDHAIEIIIAAQAVNWAPISHRHQGEERLHDRASYRYFWHVIERAERTSFQGAPQLPAQLRQDWFGTAD